MIKIRATVTALYCAAAVATVVSAPAIAATTTYISPVATVTKNTIAVSIVDYTPFFDDVFSLDVAVIDIQAPHSDDIFTPDEINYFEFTKVVTDTVVSFDTTEKFVLSPVDLNTATGTVEPDPTAAVDTMAKVFTRPDVVDTAIAAQSIANHPKPAKSEFPTATDAINSFNVGQVSDDQPTATDETAVDFTRPDVADTAIVTDDPAKDFTRPDVADTTVATDEAAKDTEKPLSHNAVAADTSVFNFGSVLDDAAVISQDDAKTFVKVLFPNTGGGDPVSVSDSLSYNFIAGTVNRALNGAQMNRTAFN